MVSSTFWARFLISSLLALPVVTATRTQAITEIVQASDNLCPPPILSRLQRHRIAPGENIASIASRYNLLPQTLIQFNPILKGGSAPAGQEILIPPLNGIRVEVPPGATWQDLAAAYGVRADVLFEINGCQEIPKVAFIPGVNWTASPAARSEDYTGLKGYPLPAPAQIGLPYGWQAESATGRSFFHSGLDLLAALGTSVLAAETGEVIFTGIEGTYGYLVIIAHGGGRQTRYAHLSQIRVKIGQKVQAGDVLGLVGQTGKPDLPQPHLHFEVRYKLPIGWIAQDPQLHLPSRASPAE